MARKKKKAASRAKPRKKSAQRSSPAKAPKRDKLGRFVSTRRSPQKRKTARPPVKRGGSRKQSPFPVSDFEFVDESEIGDFEQYFGDEDLDEDDEEEEDDDDDLDDDDNDDFDDDDFDYIEALEAEMDSEDTPLILGEWKEELADVDLEDLENVPPDDISEAVWEEILGEDFGFDDMLEYYAEGDVYEFECAIAYPSEEAA